MKNHETTDQVTDAGSQLTSFDPKRLRHWHGPQPTSIDPKTLSHWHGAQPTSIDPKNVTSLTRAQLTSIDPKTLHHWHGPNRPFRCLDFGNQLAVLAETLSYTIPPGSWHSCSVRALIRKVSDMGRRRLQFSRKILGFWDVNVTSVALMSKIVSVWTRIGLIWEIDKICAS